MLKRICDWMDSLIEKWINYDSTEEFHGRLDKAMKKRATAKKAVESLNKKFGIKGHSFGGHTSHYRNQMDSGMNSGKEPTK